MSLPHNLYEHKESENCKRHPSPEEAQTGPVTSIPATGQPRDTPAVSIILPFRDRIEWTAEAVRSVLNGSFADLEVVLVDDGSTEDISPLRKIDERVRYVRQENRGPAAARNLGLGLARGRYVAFLDSDDLFEPEKLERQVALMEDHPDVAISHTSYRLVNVVGKIIDEVPAGKYSGQVYPRIYADAHNIATPTVMTRRDALDGIRFAEGLRYGEDTLFWVRVVKGSMLLGLDEPLSRVRLHGDNTIADADATTKGLENVARYGVARDCDLDLVRRRKLLCNLYLTIAVMKLEQRKRIGFLRSTFQALLAWPFDRNVYSSLGSLLKRNVIARFRDAIRCLLGRNGTG